MTFQPVSHFANAQLERTRELMMARSVYSEMKRLLGLIDKIKAKDPKEQIALIRSHVAATAQEAAAEANVGG